MSPKKAEAPKMEKIGKLGRWRFRSGECRIGTTHYACKLLQIFLNKIKQLQISKFLRAKKWTVCFYIALTVHVHRRLLILFSIIYNMLNMKYTGSTLLYFQCTLLLHCSVSIGTLLLHYFLCSLSELNLSSSVFLHYFFADFCQSTLLLHCFF